LSDFSRRQNVAAFAPGWKSQIAKMRERIEKERTPAGQDSMAIKTGAGGLMDAEFIAQTFCLELGRHEPNTLRALQHAAHEGAISVADSGALIENYRRLRRVEAILRRWSFAGETVLPHDAAALYRVAVRCGFVNAGEFMSAIGKWRRAIRGVFTRLFSKELPP
jgi:glutamine synthetase adenylyltransferase